MLRLLLRPVFALASFLFLGMGNEKLRGYLFAFLRRRHPHRYLVSDRFDRAYVVDTSDNGTSRALFCTGSLDAAKLDKTLALLRAAGLLAGRRALIDIGANLGTICIPAVASGAFERAVAVEPEPANLRLLRANVALNDLHERIDLIGKAVSDTGGAPIELEKSPVNTGDHRVAVSRSPGRFDEPRRERITVESITIDQILETAGLDADEVLIWMDIQGHEGHALAGGARTLARRPPIVAEFWPYGMQRAGAFDAFRTAVGGYGAYIDLNDPASERRAIGTLDVLYRTIGEAGAYTDLLLLG